MGLSLPLACPFNDRDVSVGWQIRKMFDSVGHSVVKLKRIAIGPIADKYLKVGESRSLNPEEIEQIRSGKTDAPRR